MTDRPDRPRVVVIGAGISGLAAAYFLSPAADVTALEQSDLVGGKLRSAELAGQRVDVGAEAMLARRPEGLDLAATVGLADRMHEPTAGSPGLWLGGRLRPLPAGTLLGIPTDVTSVAQAQVLSNRTLARVAEEETEDHPSVTDDLDIGELVEERLGREVVDRLVDPILGGVYATPAAGLSLRAAIPALAARLRAGGSLVAAARAATAGPATPDRPGPAFVSFGGGLAALAEAVARSGAFEIRTGVAVRSLRRDATGFVLDYGPVPRARSMTADAVVLAVPAGKAAMLLRATCPAAATELAGVEATSVAIISLAFESASLPPGSGFLVPAGEGRAIKGVTFTSQKWPGTPPGLTLLRASVGRSDQTAVLQRDDAELVDLVRHELASLLGLRADPVDAVVTRWGGGLPRYAVGHADRVARIRAAVAEIRGLAVCGATFDGVGVPACIAAARLAADRIRAGLAERAPEHDRQHGQWTP
jgi:protoporphyrinogen/coproporphyrinogen III oxidase